KSPDVGANPMEVVQKKNDPLDTSGVPEPLKSLLDRMTAPDPDARFQSMDEVLTFLESGGAEEVLSDATIIAPPVKSEPEVKAEAPPPPTPPAAAKPSKPKTAKSSGGSGGLIAAVAAVVVIGAGAGAYFGGFIGGGGPEFPPVSPYSLVIANSENLPTSASGFVPDPEMQNTLVGRMNDLGGTADLTLASGDIAPTWNVDVLSVLDDIEQLDDWQLSVTGNTASISGSTSDASLLASLTEKYPANWPGGLSGTIDVALTSLFLDAAEVDNLLAQYADCGPLTQVNNPGAVGYGPDDPVLVSGTLAGEETRDTLQDALEDIADDRFVVINATLLNPTLCLVENYLPEAPSSDIQVEFKDGNSGQDVTSGDFKVGQNPVIDVIIPDSLTTGYISVSVLDVSGNVFHLLPNVGRTDNSVETLRDGQSGEVALRVAYGLNEDRPEGSIAFSVDDSSLGKSKILVIHSFAPLFRQMRPTTESAVAYTEALSARAADQMIETLDSAILTTSE
ncbi:serine/threonine protein kinase, partial [Sulfitobacter noctilucicola]